MEIDNYFHNSHKYHSLSRKISRLESVASPDIILMDITMPNLNGVDATRAIVRDNSKVKIIALSMHPDKRFVKEMLEAGASAYVLKSYLFEELTRALDVVNEGEQYLSPRITEVVVEGYVEKTHEPSDQGRGLTERERQILQLVAEGKNVKEIARSLHISPKTADTHRRNLMSKLGMTSVADLVKYALREGLTSLEF